MVRTVTKIKGQVSEKFKIVLICQANVTGTENKVKRCLLASISNGHKNKRLLLDFS